jgi:hypothetical protein
MGFKPAASLEEALNSGFIIDTRYGSKNDIAIYAVTKKADIKSGLLCLNGTLIRHISSTDNLNYVLKDDTTQVVTDDAIAKTLIRERSWQRCAHTFSGEDIEKKLLWVPDPEAIGTEGWRTYRKQRRAFLLRYKKDIKECELYNQE